MSQRLRATGLTPKRTGWLEQPDAVAAVRRPRRGLLIGMLVGAMLSLTLPGPSAAAEPDVDAEAERVLKSMSSFLAGLDAFSVRADVDAEIVDLEGQKLQLSSTADLLLARPNQLHAQRKGPLADIAIIFDGEQLTVHGKRLQVYIQREVSGSIDDAIRYLHAETGLPAPASDLFVADPYAALMTDVTQGVYIGTGYVDGLECDHIAFRADQVDWQLWVRTGDEPLPMKYIITSKWITGAPQYSVRFTDWDLEPSIAPSQFQFVAPEGARQIEALSVDTLGALITEEQAEQQP
jgi:hypothetical protein